METGGGASRSTDPASGSSTATDVSLREHLGDKIHALDRALTSEIDCLRRETHTANSNSDKAIEVAAHEATERLKAHNGLIEQMRQQAEAHQSQQSEQASSFLLRDSYDEYKDAQEKRLSKIERFQAMLTGGMILVSFIGIANLIKVWSG